MAALNGERLADLPTIRCPAELPLKFPRPYVKPVSGHAEPLFLNTISHPRELYALNANSGPADKLFKTIGHSREIELLTENSRQHSLMQMQKICGKPKRLGRKRPRKTYKEERAFDGARNKQRTKNVNKSKKATLPETNQEGIGFSNVDYWGRNESRFKQNNHHHQQQQQQQQLHKNQSARPKDSEIYGTNPRRSWETKRDGLVWNPQANARCDYQDRTPYLGILHAKMDPENKPVCAFCKRNNSKDYHHQLKDEFGGVVCPVLSAFTCKMCAATGRNAHTHKYCPVNPITKGDPVAAGMPPGRPLTKEDRQWLKYFHARFILDLFFRNQVAVPCKKFPRGICTPPGQYRHL